MGVEAGVYRLDEGGSVSLVLTKGEIMRLKARCGRCNVLMVASQSGGVRIWDCLVCGRAVLTGSPADVLAYERRMLANGFVCLK
jgi:hypothetical protein